MKCSDPLNINQKVVNSENCLKFLGVEINSKLSCEKQLSTQCKKN